MNAKGEGFLYVEGFSRDTTSTDFVQGVYLQWSDVPQSYRNTKNSAPGVQPATVIEQIMNDIEEESTTGFLTKDSDGKAIGIYIDFLGFIEDTPAFK